MGDDGRKHMMDKASEKMTPQDSKSTTDKIGEGISDTADKAQRDLVPDDQKSTGQSLSDKASREKDAHSDKTTMDKVKDTLGMGGK